MNEEKQSINQTTENNKRIAKNTIFLYLRMFIIMGVFLYTSRIILDVLGVEDFGIYNVVGGVVALLSFFNNAMTASTQRFLTFELGRNDFVRLKRVFSMAINIHILLAIVIAILAETIGLWFLNTKLNIPDDRMIAAIWVYHFSILTLIISVIRIPYNAMIIAHEKMSFFAWASILEVTLKLVIVYMLVIMSMDKLQLYGILTFGVTFAVTLLYYIYCKRKYEESNYAYNWDIGLFKSLLSFTGWSLFGNMAYVDYLQGLNMLLNIFFGPAVNAARGIAFQVNSAVISFVGNYQTAASPQITKYYAAGDKQSMIKLIMQSSRFSYYLLFIVALPILLGTEIILKTWLTVVPDFTVIFCQLVIINTLIDCLSGTIIPAVQATGKIKMYQITVGIILLFNIPLSYLFLKMGFLPQVTMWISIVLSILALFSRLFIVKKLLKFPISLYIKEVIIKALLITAVSSILPYYLGRYLNEGYIRFFIISFLALLSTVSSIYFIGLKSSEKDMVLKKINGYLTRS